MSRILQGALGVIENFFDAPLGEGSHHISPQRISTLPSEQLGRLDEILQQHQISVVEDLFEDYATALNTYDSSVTMLIADYSSDAIANGLRSVAYLGRVLVDEPINRLSVPDDRRHRGGGLWSPESIERALTKLMRIRPLIVGGYLNLFPETLLTRLGLSPEVEEEYKARYNETFYRFGGALWDDHSPRGRAAVRSGARMAWSEVLPIAKLSAALKLPVLAMDTTGQAFVRRFLGQQLEHKRLTALSAVTLPRLDRLSPADLATLLSSDEVLADLRNTLADILDNLPDDDDMDLDGVIEFVERRVAAELRTCVRRLERRLQATPDWGELIGGVTAIGATLFAGIVTKDPAIATAVGAVGASTGLASEWASRNINQRKTRQAVRVLRELAQ